MKFNFNLLFSQAWLKSLIPANIIPKPVEFIHTTQMYCWSGSHSGLVLGVGMKFFSLLAEELRVEFSKEWSFQTNLHVSYNIWGKTWWITGCFSLHHVAVSTLYLVPTAT